MISFQEALYQVLNTNFLMKTETVHLHESMGRVLASDIVSDINMPPFDKSAMDGFAIKEADIDKELTIIETIAAGKTPEKKITEGTAAKIMTGAPVPEGADFVIQVELSEMTGSNKVRFTGHPSNNIILKAEDVITGDKVLSKGQVIDARHIAVLAASGITEPLVYKKPLVGIISTGDEIVEPGIKPELSQIRNSNGHQLVGQIIQSHATPKYYGIVNDSYQATLNAIKKGLSECDILLLTGGVSMGDFDFVPKIITNLGISILFDAVAVQPGKPTTYGKKDNKFVFGLPGNPVSAYIQFEILVKPLLQKITGTEIKSNTISLPLGINYKRKKGERKAYIPVNINNTGQVIPAEYHGSAHIFALPDADGLAVINEGFTELNKGDLVDVRLF